MDLDIARDGRVYWVERTTKKLQVFDPANNGVQIVHTFDASQVMSENTNYEGNGNEGGLQGIALDGDFGRNRFIYLYYTARVPEFSSGAFKPVERLSRFTLIDNGTRLDLQSEVRVLEFTIYAQCCHHGGDLEWGPDGNLWLTTGDNTSLTYNTDGVPINDGNVKLDARSGTANTNSYRGKILRIRPTAARQPDGKWYTIPEGNLFPPGTALTLPEIYSMGHRNPYSISFDTRNHGDNGGPWVLVGEAGPAKGTDEVNLIKKPGFFGWPFLNRDNFSMGASQYQADRIINNSPFNTGMQNLPPAQGALAWYGAGGNSGHGLAGCVPGVGPFLSFDSTLSSKSKFPPYFNDKVILFTGWGGDFRVGTLSVGGVLSDVKRIFSSSFGAAVLRAKRGPDGALYTISNGGEFFAPGSGDKIFRISYVGPCNPPVVARQPVARSEILPARAMMISLSPISSITLPAGVRKVELYDLGGRKVWSHRRSRSLARETVSAPAGFANGLYSLRYSD